MSRASEWAAEERDLSAKQPRWRQENALFQATVTAEGGLYLLGIPTQISGQGALSFGRWLVETFGEETA